MMKLRAVLWSGILTLLSFASPVLAQDGPYIQMDLTRFS